ncbi:hypothetical protein BCR33DRAFT_756772 [Rhizoclosmatium globosum]|uniref:NAD(P)-binding protein n=1 Tax=Rhizoclosmatium globosum TaxID=329046 RepID=A0A1Y1ZKS6_9FUNG|nr:hypothetical protein BCR33DRAFT_756772 [Rhizoclosmatium globosum]|eukprot:ORY10826.1 hypothetical protein BCR33DRAFT_756772 [Rhizoclosmatium globosum]
MPFSVQDIPNLAGKTFVANEAIAKITKVAPGAKVKFLELKLNDLKQVDAAAKKLVSSGVMIFNTPFALTSDVNHVGHFAFTMALMPAILKSTEPRIVNLNDSSALSSYQRYGQSKLANILFTKSLHKRFGDRITVLDGALTQIYLACSTEIVEKGYKDGYFAPIADKKRGEKELSALGRNEDLAEKLWQFTENLVKEKIAA